MLETPQNWPPEHLCFMETSQILERDIANPRARSLMRKTHRNCPLGHICLLETSKIHDRDIANPRVRSLMRETNQNCPPGHICFLKTPQIFERDIANPRVRSLTLETHRNCPPGHICFLKTPQIFERHIANPRVRSPLYWRPTKTARWSTVVSFRHRKSWIALSLILETRHNYTRQACSFPGAIANPRARLPLMLEAHQNCPLGRLCFTETAQILECSP